MKIRKMSGVAAGLLSIVMALSMAGCSLPSIGKSENASSDTTGPSAEEILQEEPLVAETKDDGRYHVGILTYRDHGAADETVQGFEEELRALLGSSKVDFETASAEGDPEKCARIATEFANSGYSLIFACGTEAVQNAGAAVKDTPIIGGCVSDYLLSGVVSSLEAPGGNISGVSSLGPIEDQMAQIERNIGWQDMVGIVSSGTEVGSRFQESIAGQCLNEDGYDWKSYHASTPEGLRKAMELAAAECGCIYLPTDNYVASNMDIVREVVLETGIPVATGDYQMCSRGGLFCCSIDYYEHGKKAAGMAYSVLEKGEEISRLAIQEEEEWSEYYNPQVAEAIEWYNYGGMIPLDIPEDAAIENGTEEESGEEEAAAEDQ